MVASPMGKRRQQSRDPAWTNGQNRLRSPAAVGGVTIEREGRMLGRIIATAVAALGLAAASAAADAQELTGTLKKIKDSGAITLGHRQSSGPFSDYHHRQQVVGHAMDLCGRIVDAVKKELKLDRIEVRLNPVTSATRIPLMANGTIDLECGSTTNNLERQRQVAFTITHFVTANRFVSKKAANLRRS